MKRLREIQGVVERFNEFFQREETPTNPIYKGRGDGEEPHINSKEYFQPFLLSKGITL